MVVDELTDDAVDRLFHALADGTRRDIVAAPSRGELSVSRLAAAYPMSFAAVQKHVAVLERAGLVTKERAGASSSCAPTSPPSTGRGRPSTSSRGLARAGGPDGRPACAGLRPTREHD